MDRSVVDVDGLNGERRVDCAAKVDRDSTKSSDTDGNETSGGGAGS